MKTLEQSGDAAPSFEGCESPAQQIALLESMVAEMHQEMQDKDRTIEQLQYAVVEMEHQMAAAPVGGGRVSGGGVERGAAAEHIASLEAQISQKEDHIAQLEEALVSAERALHNKAGDAEERAQYLEAVVNEKNNKVVQLQASLDAMSQAAPAMAQEGSAAAERNLERALEAEERALQLASVVEEKTHIISRIEAELVQLKMSAATAGDSSAQAQIAAEAEAKAHHLQVLVDAKDQQIVQLEHLLQGMQEQTSRARAATLKKDDGQWQALFQQKEEEIRRLNEDLAGASKRAEIAEAGRRDLRKELASSTEEVVRLQVALDGKDVHMAQLVEDEKRSSGAHKQVIEAEVSRLQTCIAEKDRLIEQLMAAVATNKVESGNAEVAQLTQSFEQEVLQLTKSFEEERSALRVQMMEQFEQEYAALRGQVKRLQYEAESAMTEREATAMELRQVVSQYEERLLAASPPWPVSEEVPEFRAGPVPTAWPTVVPPGGAYATKVVEVSSAWPQMPEGPTIMQRPTVVELRQAPMQQQGLPKTPRSTFRASYIAPSPISRRGMPMGAEVRAVSPMRAASPPRDPREMWAASPPTVMLTEVRAASPPPVMCAASPPRDPREMRAASPPPVMRAASPMTRPRTMPQAAVQLPFAAPVSVTMQVPVQVPQTHRAASPPVGGAPAGGSVALPSGRQSAALGGSTAAAPSFSAAPGGSILVGQGGSVALLPGGSASIPQVGGNLVALSPGKQSDVLGGTAAAAPSFSTAPGGSILVGQGGSVALLPGSSPSIPPAGGSLVASTLKVAVPSGQGSVALPPASQQAASQRAFAVVSPPRSRPQMAEDGIGPQRQASPLHMAPVAAPQLSGFTAPPWAMQQPMQPQVDSSSKYLLPAGAMGARQAAGEGGITPVTLARVMSSSGAGRSAHATTMAMDLGRDVGMVQEQPSNVYFIPRPEIVGAEGAYLDAPYAGAHHDLLGASAPPNAVGHVLVNGPGGVQ